MFVFGNKKRFAIETDISYETKDHRTIGSIILWVDNEKIGHSTNIAPLSVSLSTFESILFNPQKWTSNELFYKSAENIIRFYHSMVFHICDNHEIGAIPEDSEHELYRNKFMLCPNLSEVFDGCFVLTVSNGEGDWRILWSKNFFNSKLNPRYGDIKVNNSEFIYPIKNFCLWIYDTNITTSLLERRKKLYEKPA
jgi:hypothetical protein